MSTVAPPERKQRPRSGDPGSGSGRPWLVVVLNDNHNTFDGVAFALARTIPGVTFDRGMELANTIHTAGRAVVWSGRRSRPSTTTSNCKASDSTLAPLSSSG